MLKLSLSKGYMLQIYKVLCENPNFFVLFFKHLPKNNTKTLLRFIPEGMMEERIAKYGIKL